MARLVGRRRAPIVALAAVACLLLASLFATSLVTALPIGHQQQRHATAARQRHAIHHSAPAAIDEQIALSDAAVEYAALAENDEDAGLLETDAPAPTAATTTVTTSVTPPAAATPAAASPTLAPTAPTPVASTPAATPAATSTTPPTPAAAATPSPPGTSTPAPVTTPQAPGTSAPASTTTPGSAPAAATSATPAPTTTAAATATPTVSPASPAAATTTPLATTKPPATTITATSAGAAPGTTTLPSAVTPAASAATPAASATPASAPAPATPAAAPVVPAAGAPATAADNKQGNSTTTVTTTVSVKTTPAAAPVNKTAADEVKDPGFINELRFDPAARPRRAQLRKVVSASPTPGLETSVANFTATFTFVKGSTSDGYVLDTLKDKDIESLAKACYDHARCTGFTSSGDLKSFIRPASKWLALNESKSAGVSSVNIDPEVLGLYYQPQWYRFQPVPCPCNATVDLNFVCSDPMAGDPFLGDPLTDASCYRQKPQAGTKHACAAKTCVPLEWKYKPFPKCPTCGQNITISREVKCVSTATGTIFPDAACALVTKKPATEFTCQADVACAWKTQDPGTCSQPCGPGLKTLNVTCSSPVDPNEPVPEHFCTTTKPKALKKCHLKDCVWTTVADGKCSNSCGAGVATLKATCIEPGKPDVVLPDQQCAGLTKPKMLIKCNQRACAWDSKPTSPCSQPCGAGRQSVANVCKDPVTGDVVPSKLCDAQPPPSFQYCSVRACAWETRPLGTCSTACGHGVQRFDVLCTDPATGHRVDDAQCKTLKPPAHEAPCQNNACGWRARPIGQCSAPCGPGTMKYNVTCEDPLTGAPIDEALCGPDKPPTEGPCQQRECHWHRSLKGACSSLCGAGIQQFSLSCKNPVDGTTQKMEQCKNVAVPPLTEACSVHACEWRAKKVGECSELCGPGRQERAITCHDPVTAARVPDELCADLTLKPKTNVPCYRQACIWNTIPLTKCSETCGQGTMTVNVTCTDPQKQFQLPDTQCFDASKPNTTQTCMLQECRWKVTPATECSSTCGKGTQTLNVVCHDPTANKEQRDELCDADNRPKKVASCFLKPCSWVKDDPPPKKCSAPCGPGEVKVNVTCQDASVGTVYSDELCTEKKPEGIQPCQLAECKWSRSWTPCNATCGGAFQYATDLKCVTPDKAATVVSNAQCRASPQLWKQCATKACTAIDEAFLYYNFEDDFSVGAGSKVVNRVNGGQLSAQTLQLAGLLQGAGAKAVGGRGGRGKALQLSASEDHTSGPYVVIPASKLLQSQTFSLSFWMQLLAQPTQGRNYILLDNRGIVGSGEGFVLYLDARDGMLYVNDAYSDVLGASHMTDSGVAFPNDGQMHHVAVTYDGKMFAFFLDGKQTSAKDLAHTFALTVPIGQHDVYLRGSQDKYWRVLPMNLAEFAYFSYALGPVQVQVLADPELKNVCAAGEILSGGGCAPYANKGDILDAQCRAGSPFDLKKCLQPLWGLHSCSTLSSSYPTSAADLKLWNAQPSWASVKETVAKFAAKDVVSKEVAKLAWGTCQNRLPSALDAQCDHPPPYHSRVCIQGLFVESECSRKAKGFPESDAHPLVKELNALSSWRDVKARMAQLVKADVKGGTNEGFCYDTALED